MLSLRSIFFIFLHVCLSPIIYGLDVVSVEPAPGQEAHSAGSELRCVGKRISLAINFSEAPDAPGASTAASFHVYLRNTTTSAIYASPAPTISPSSTSTKKWIYSFNPIDDGPVDVAIAIGAASIASVSPTIQSSAFTYQFTTDFIPEASITATPNGASHILFSLTTFGFEPAENPVTPNDAKISVQNGYATSLLISGTSIPYDVQPFGYGSITFTAQPSYLTDKWGNTNDAASLTQPFNAPTGTTLQAPHVVSVVGISQENLVYRTGDTIFFNVVFDRNLYLASNPSKSLVFPTIRLNSTGSGTAAIADVISRSGPTLFCKYVVQAGHHSVALDVADANALTLASETALIGITSAPDFIADYTLPIAGASGSLSEKTLYSINVEPAKPSPEGVNGSNPSGNCGAGSGIAVVLSVTWLALFFFRRRID